MNLAKTDSESFQDAKRKQRVSCTRQPSSGSGTAKLFRAAELNNHLSDTPWRVQTSRKQRERQRQTSGRFHVWHSADCSD